MKKVSVERKSMFEVYYDINLGTEVMHGTQVWSLFDTLGHSVNLDGSRVFDVRLAPEGEGPGLRAIVDYAGERAGLWSMADGMHFPGWLLGEPVTVIDVESGERVEIPGADLSLPLKTAWELIDVYMRLRTGSVGGFRR